MMISGGFRRPVATRKHARPCPSLSNIATVAVARRLCLRVNHACTHGTKKRSVRATLPHPPMRCSSVHARSKPLCLSSSIRYGSGWAASMSPYGPDFKMTTVRPVTSPRCLRRPCTNLIVPPTRATASPPSPKHQSESSTSSAASAEPGGFRWWFAGWLPPSTLTASTYIS